jgi:hypothetical protein
LSSKVSSPNQKDLGIIGGCRMFTTIINIQVWRLVQQCIRRAEEVIHTDMQIICMFVFTVSQASTEKIERLPLPQPDNQLTATLIKKLTSGLKTSRM